MDSDEVTVCYIDYLPVELLVIAFSDLSLSDLVHCSSVCKRFKDAIDGSLLLQYHIALARGEHPASRRQIRMETDLGPPLSSSSSPSVGAVDNSNSSIPTSLKLKRLEAQERGWAYLSPARRDTIPIPRRFGSFDLSGGLLVGARAPPEAAEDASNVSTPESDDEDMNACELLGTTLPSTVTGDFDVRSWSRNVGFPVYGLGIDTAQDLAIVIQSRASTNEPFQIHLLALSTFLPHPLAAQRTFEHLIPIPVSQISVRCMGTLVGLMLHSFDAEVFQQTLLVFDWKTGATKACIESTKEGRFFDDFGFVSADTVVLPVRKPGPASLDVYKFDTRKVSRRSERLSRGSHPPSVRIASFRLPEMRDPLEVSVNPICCNTEPPLPHAEMYAASSSSGGPSAAQQPPFRLDGNNSLMSFSFMVCHGHSAQSTAPLHERFTLVVQRRAFVARVDEVVRSANGRWVGSQWRAVILPWTNWGPHISRWLTMKHLSWACFMSGSRLIMSPIIPEDRTRCHLQVLDFNPYVVAKECQWRKHNLTSRKEDAGYCEEAECSDKWSGRGKGKGKEKQKEEPIDVDAWDEEFQAAKMEDNQVVLVKLVDSTKTIPSGKLWAEPVESHLPYRQVTTRESFPYANVVIDEERIGGILAEERLYLSDHLPKRTHPLSSRPDCNEGMLDHLFSLFGPSTVPPVPFRAPARALILHATGNTVSVLDAGSLALVRVLAFWEAFSSTLGGDVTVANVAVDEEKQLVVASLGSQITAWSCSSADGSQWRVHSTTAVSGEITCLDCNSGFVILGTQRTLSEYELDEAGDLPTWNKKWSIRLVQPYRVHYSPGRTHFACLAGADNAVLMYSTRTRRQTQRMRHPAPPVTIAWRSPRSGHSNRNDLILFTLTPDGTVRVFMTVLDAPDVLQLHASVDCFGFMPDRRTAAEGSRVFWLDRNVVQPGLQNVLQETAETSEPEHGRRPLLKQILDESWDLFVRILPDGSMVIRALANVDRRPPTMLKQFTILHTPPNYLPIRSYPSSLSLHLHPGSDKPFLSLLTSPPFRSYEWSLLEFFDAQPSGLRHLARSYDPPSPTSSNPTKCQGMARPITNFERTPDGNAITVARSDGSREIWTRGRGGRLKLLSMLPPESEQAEHVVCLFNEGRTIALYSSETETLHVKHFSSDNHDGPPYESLEQSIALKTASKPILFSLPPTEDYMPIACATSAETTLILVTLTPKDDHRDAKITLRLQHTKPLPVSVPPQLIMPVDPMAWNPPTELTPPGVVPHRIDSNSDAFVSISPEGELSFWVPAAPVGTTGGLLDLPGWRCTGRVHTQRRKIAMAQCSSSKKTVLVVDVPDGQEVTIWDSKESEFSSGLEYSHIYSDNLEDLDWTSTYDSLSILALGFAQKVLVLCPQRMSYFDERPTWGTIHVIDTSGLTPALISDSIWLSGGSLIVGAGHHMLLYGEPTQTVLRPPGDKGESLFENVARQNGPLDDFHPQLILQCLIWNKVDLVKRIITLLAQNLAASRAGGSGEVKQLPLESFWEDDDVPSRSGGKRAIEVSSLFSNHFVASEEEETFSRDLVTRLTESLEASPLPHLTPSEMEHLIVLIHTTLEIDEQRRSLDANGVRYMISIRSFFLINRRVVESNGSTTPNSKRGILAPFVRERIRYRDIVWAFHSESQEILMDASTVACGGKMLWLDARALGVFLWGTSIDALRSQMEIIARNQYMAGDARDPTACCLFYFALGKVKLVHGLWKQAAWHREQSMMLKFLSNDFSDPRWKTAALKNAFALLSKQRHEYAAAFFLLGGSLKDAVNVCLKQLGDFQLAVALARVVEGDDGVVLRAILQDHVIPRAFREGNRWLGSWAFWMLKRRDLAVRILLTPLRELAAELVPQPEDIGDPHFDDPSLAVLFAQLKAKSLQTVKGTSEISGQTEFNFVHQMARVLCRMGCHVLALDLVQSWSFDRPIVAVTQLPKDLGDLLDQHLQDLTNSSPSVSPLRDRSKSQSRPPLSPAFRKTFARLQRSSMIIDMELPSFPPTRASSPPTVNGVTTNGSHPDAVEAEARGRERKSPVVMNEVPPVPVPVQTGFGNLMKTAKKDVVVPEFDMSTFF